MGKYISKSEKYLNNKNADTRPLLTTGAMKGVSDYRQMELIRQVKQGQFHNYSEDDTSSGYPAPIFVSGMKKTAETFSSGGGGGGSWRGTGGTQRMMPEIYSPLWLTSNLNLPRDKATINAWCRAFFTLNPYVRNAILLHSTYPISKLNIKCKDPKIGKFFETMIEEIDLLNICSQMAQEYWTIGETFPFAELDEGAGKWRRILIQNPDYITVQGGVSSGDTVISLRPDENLRRIVTSNRPSDVQQRQKLNPAVVQHVLRGENIPLDNYYISHLANKIAPYEIRGTGLPVTCFKSLMLWDQLREAKYVQASDMINPISIWKIGGPEFKPTPIDLEAWREIVEQSTYDRNFKIVTHEQVSLERVGANQGIYDATNDFTALVKEFYVGLLVPSVIIDGGGDTTYQNGGVALDVLRQRYMMFRNMMTTWLRRKIFAPISRINEFYENIDGEKVLIVPEVDWNHMSLFDTADYIAKLSELAGGEDPKVSLHSLYRGLGLNMEEETRRIREEQIQFAILKKEKAALDAMPLSELRALNPEDEIKEVVDESGVPGMSNVPGVGELSGLPGLGTSPETPSPTPTPTPTVPTPAPPPETPKT